MPVKKREEYAGSNRKPRAGSSKPSGRTVTPDDVSLIFDSINYTLITYDAVYDLFDHLVNEKVRREKIANKEWEVYNHIVDAAFRLLTGDKRSFDEFYDSFDAPGTSKGLKPVAWDCGFIPDAIRDTMISKAYTAREKIKRITRFYKVCAELEDAFKQAQLGKMIASGDVEC
jgi:hypothetical protein